MTSTKRLISDACEALPPLWPGSSTTVLPASPPTDLAVELVVDELVGEVDVDVDGTAVDVVVNVSAFCEPLLQAVRATSSEATPRPRRLRPGPPSRRAATGARARR